MRTIYLVLILSFTLQLSPSNASDDLLNAGRASSIDFLLDNAIRNGLISGGITVVGNSRGVLYETSRGTLYNKSESNPISNRTLFDVASLTKVIATTPAVMKLLENGKLNLLDPITRWFPELDGSGMDEITILNLLTHTSGFDDVEIPTDAPFQNMLVKTARQLNPPVNRFRYADINFILLGEVVSRASGIPLDRFCNENLYAPIGMAETQFQPKLESTSKIAPTAGADNSLSAGVVQDINSRRLGGIAGHAGLFSTAADLTRFALMMLNNGNYLGKELFEGRTIAQMTAPYFYSKGRIIRGLGWDMNSPFSAPKGDHFSEISFGHTGYSGTSMWIDPEQDLFVILLTIRLDYRNIRQFNRLRKDVSTLAASIFSNPRWTREMATSLQGP